jgi:hypothetical protein
MATKLTATLHGYYVKNGKNVYRYLVNGTSEALSAYEEAQGSNFTELRCFSVHDLKVRRLTWRLHLMER